MLTMMRSMLRSKFSGLLFVLLIVAMAAWGVTDIFTGGSGNSFASAGKRQISDQQFDAAVERFLRNQTDANGNSITKAEAAESGLIDRIFQSESVDVALQSYGDTIGITATEAAIERDLKATPMFQDTTGEFDNVRFLELMGQNGFRTSEFLADIGVSETVSRLQRLPQAALKAPSSLARIEAAFTGEIRNAEWFTLSAAELPEIGEPTKEQLQALYDENREALRYPERRAVTLIRLTVDDYIDTSDILDEDVENFYDAYKSERYTAADTRTFTLYQFASRQDALNARAGIAIGVDPSQIEGLSGNITRQGQRGSIGAEKFDQEVFAPIAQVGNIFGPQDLNGTWTIIKLNEITAGAETPLETVREAIRNEIARDEAIGLYYEALDRFDELIGTGAPLEDIARALGTPSLSFRAVSAQGVNAVGQTYQPLTENPALLQEIFTLPVGERTSRIGENEVAYKARLDAIEDTRLPTLDEVRDDMIFVWKQREQATQLQTVSGEIEARVKSGESTMAEEAARYNAEIETSPRPLTRVNFQANLPRTMIQGLFAAKNEGDMISASGLPGSSIILRVSVIDRPAPETLDLLANSAIAATEQALNNDLAQAFFSEIQSTTDLNINDSAFAAYKRSLQTTQ
jgi:peptidyl-prolyl cis-trans isomerase D